MNVKFNLNINVTFNLNIDAFLEIFRNQSKHLKLSYLIKDFAGI